MNDNMREALAELLAVLDAYLYTNDYGGYEVSKHHSTDVTGAIVGARAALSAPARQALPAFEIEWKNLEAKGYRYGQDALEHVRFGYGIARAALQGATAPTKAEGASK